MSSSSSSTSSSSDSDSSWPYSSSFDYFFSTYYLFIFFLFFFFLDFGGRAMFYFFNHSSCFYFYNFFSFNSSAPSIFHSSGLTKCSKAVGSSIISLRSFNRLYDTFIEVLITFSFTVVVISPSSFSALSLSSLTYFFKWHSALMAMYSWAKSSCSSCRAKS